VPYDGLARKSPGLFRSQAPIRAGVLSVMLVLGGCNAYNDVTGSINPAATAPVSEDAARAQVDELGRRYSADPNDKVAAMNYALGLRANGRYAEAVAVLENLAIKNPDDTEVLGAYGKALADVGRLREAGQVLANAQSPQHPNWSILSAQGAVADQLGNHVQAQEYYQTALRIAPGEPSVLSNLGLSYALSKQLDQAEAVLRQAAASPGADSRVRQNLALVLALRGKFAEAEAVDRTDLSPAQAAANVAAIRQMIAQSDTWREIQQSGANGQSSSAGASTDSD
jgi:Flp pilus assembly protein TadD